MIKSVQKLCHAICLNGWQWLWFKKDIYYMALVELHMEFFSCMYVIYDSYKILETWTFQLKNIWLNYIYKILSCFCYSFFAVLVLFHVDHIHMAVPDAIYDAIMCTCSHICNTAIAKGIRINDTSWVSTPITNFITYSDHSVSIQLSCWSNGFQGENTFH